MKRTILVTGGNRGIGKAICEGLAKMDLAGDFVREWCNWWLFSG